VTQAFLKTAAIADLLAWTPSHPRRRLDAIRVTVGTMTLDEALRITARATELAGARGVSVAVAVVDAGGHLVTLHRMDGVPFIAAEVAWGKAWTAAAWGEASREQGAKAARLPQFATAITVASGGRYTSQAGVYPSGETGRVIGAAGASGLASGEVDDEILQQAVTDALTAGPLRAAHGAVAWGERK
jgi:glc operon protein GlcG